MSEDRFYIRRVRPLKWLVLGGASLAVVAAQAYCYFVRHVPLSDGLIHGLVALAIVILIVELSFRITLRAQRRLQREITERERTEGALLRRNREAVLLNLTSQAFNSTLDLDQVLTVVLEEVRHLMGVVSSSIWLVDHDTAELLCRQSVGLRSDIVRGWRMPMGEGLVGKVAQTGQSLIVADTRIEQHHYKDVDRQTGLELRSILSVPLRVKQNVIGVMQVLDIEIDCFESKDLELVESLAASAAVAIDNARLYEETDRLRAFNENLVRSMEEGILLEDAEGHIIFTNPKAASRLGYAPKELIGQHWRSLTAPKYLAQAERESAKRPQGISSRYEIELLARDGQRIPVIVSACPLFEGGKFEGVVVVFTDITERVQAEGALRESEERYRGLVERVPVGLYRTTPMGEILDANPALIQMLGYPDRETLISMNAADVFVDPRDRRREQTLLQQQGVVRNFEAQLYRRDGTVIWVWDTARAVCDATGQVLHYEGSLEDITERKRAEQDKQRLEERLDHAHRMESLGVVAGGVAHDLNNILGPLVAYPELIMDELPTDSPVRADVLEIQQAANRAAAVAQDLLALARRGVYRMTPVNLNLVVEEYLRSSSFTELQARHPNFSVKVCLAATMPNLLGSPPHLSKVIMNLVTNAVEAMPNGGQLTITTACLVLDRPLHGCEKVEPGEYVTLTVADTGVGIAPEDLSKVFEPFFTRKKMGRSGSGLGLAVVHGVMQDHDGKIDLHSKVGKGTEFTLYFRATSKRLWPVVEEGGDYSGEERILIVDDLKEQRDLVSRLLSTLGYCVKAVENGREAVEYLKNNSTDLVILDMILEEGLDGLDTYRQILSIHPNQKAIISSGFSVTDRVEEAQKLGAGRFLKKPYTLSRLGQAVRQELDASPPTPTPEPA